MYGLTNGEIDREIKQVILVHPNNGTECPEIPLDPTSGFWTFEGDPLIGAVRGLQLRVVHLRNPRARGCLFFELFEHPVRSRRRAPELFAKDRVND